MGTNAGRCTQLAILSLVVLTASAALRARELSTVEESLLAEARAALSRAATYFRSRISTRGSYLWSYSSDLKQRRGEREATATQGWVQPPGTPSVGMAYLDAYEATGDSMYLEAARETAHALARTQLASGGWDYRIEFDPRQSKRWYYRRDVEAGDLERGGRRNTTTYDDDTTQSALRFLIRTDRVQRTKEPRPEDRDLTKAVRYGLAKVLEAQYPNGAWPQRWDGTPRRADEYPVKRARYPESWSRAYPRPDYRSFYTLNDHAIPDLVRTLLVAHRAYGEDRHLQAAKRAGDFLILAQMPDPQPAWAQQYNLDMEPAWARKFEPPSVVSGESVGAVRTLLDLYLYTGEEKYRAPIRRALEWFRRSRLEDRAWARFYELKTNRPLYFDKQYRLVYTADDMPTHYSFKSTYGIPELLEAVETLERKGREKTLAERDAPQGRDERRRRAKRMTARIQSIIAGLDEAGRWLDSGTLNSRTFCRNVAALAAYIKDGD